MKKSEIYKEEGVNLASKVPPEIAGKFRSQARQRRQQIKVSLAIAAKLWVELPAELQATLLSTSEHDIYNILVNWIRDDVIRKYLEGLSPKQKIRLLALAKEAI